ncbi:MAG: 4-aminobutyrate--2-oxoglutarate transaminase [Candidatus Nanopelagicales bacterium]
MSETFGPDLPQIRKVVTEIPGPRSQALSARRKAAVSGALGAAVPIYADRAGGGVIIDVDGNSFIDFAAGIAVTNVGNSAPDVVAEVTEQVRKLTHTCFMVAGYEPYIEVCEQLNELTPGDHDKKSALFNSGAEAVENAIKVARAHTKRHAVVVFEHAYHGRTNLTMGMTAKNMPYKESFGPFSPEVYRVPTSYPLRDGLDGAAAAARSLQRIEFEVGSHNVAAVMIEPIKGEGGFIVPAPGFLPAIQEWCTANGAVFIADEIQTGFGRTGAWFACDHENVVPDVITTAKGIAGGFPLAGVTGRPDIMDAVHVGGLGGTYGGNPVACAAALGAIRTMREQDLPARARAIGDRLVSRLTELAAGVPSIAEVRGRGAMIAIEFAEPGSLKALPDIPKAVAAACAQQGVVILTAGTYGNVIRLLPPLVIGDELLDDGLDVLCDAIRVEAGR